MTTLGAADALAEVENGPSDSSIAAVFDLDGTLIDGFSASHFFRHRLRNRDIDANEMLRTIRLGVDALLGQIDFDTFMTESGRAFAGKREADLMQIGDEIFESEIADLMYPDMRALVRAHQKRGHTVVLASSSTRYQAEPMAKALAIHHVLCNRMSVDDEGRLTGEMDEPIIWGPGKALVVQRFAAEHGLDLDRSYFYADGEEDRTLMHVVGHPRPVNPARRLERIARRRGWPTLRVERAGEDGDSPSRLARARTIAGIASLLPSIAVGGSIGLLQGDKRAALNTALPLWLDSMFRLGGVELNVVRGREHLESPRPAVFLWNHRNGWDAFMVMALVRTNVTGVGKQELAKDPILGPIGRLMDAAFIDRDDAVSAVAALKPIEDLARKGLSVLISPEGTRTPDGSLQPFKKGPFRIAMSVGLPIIPIIFRNADDIASRESATMLPGTVDVVILPPIDVSDWTLEDLSKRIEGVRQQFADTLDHWPG